MLQNSPLLYSLSARGEEYPTYSTLIRLVNCICESVRVKARCTQEGQLAMVAVKVFRFAVFDVLLQRSMAGYILRPNFDPTGRAKVRERHQYRDTESIVHVPLMFYRKGPRTVCARITTRSCKILRRQLAVMEP